MACGRSYRAGGGAAAPWPPAPRDGATEYCRAFCAKVVKLDGRVLSSVPALAAKRVRASWLPWFSG